MSNETLHIYTRVSTTTQEEEGTSLETQLELGVERAKKLGMKHRVWNEGGQSSAHDDLANRPVLVNLLKDIESGEIEHLYVWNTDRLSRNLNTWGMIRYQLIKNDVVLHTPTGKQILSDPQTNLMLGIMSEISQYDNQLRTERFRLGKLSRIRKGGWKGGPPPYGYDLVDKKLVPNIKEKKWVNFIFDNYNNGKSFDDIRTLLLKNGVVTRRGNAVWSHGSIRSLLTNTHYSGFYNYTDKKSGETIRVSTPEIVPAQTIIEANKQREKRGYGTNSGFRTKTSNEKYDYLLRDFLVCGHCGSRFSGNHKKTQTSYYYCSAKQKNYKNKNTEKYIVCDSKRNIRLDATDELIWNTVIDVVSKSHIFKESLKKKMLSGQKTSKEAKVDSNKLKLKVKKIDKEILDVTESIVNFETARLLGKRDKAEAQKIIQNLESHRLNLKSKKGTANAALAETSKDKKWIDWIGKFGNQVDEMKSQDFKKADRKRFLQGVVEKIVVKNLDSQKHEIKINFRLPYVNDELIWNDDRVGHRLKNGYTLKNGKKSKVLRVNLLKKL